MKSLEFNLNSWHYWVANNHGGYYRGNDDFCHYIRCVIWGLCCLSGIGFLIAFCLFCIGDWMAWAAASIVNWQLIDIDLMINPWHFGAVIVNIVLAACSVLGGIGLSAIALDNYGDYRRSKRHKEYMAQRDPNYVPPQPGFIKQAYRSIKEKTCFRVTFKE